MVYSGTGYVAAVGGYANPVDTFLVSVSGESQGSCYIQDNGCDIGSGGFGYWYTTSETPMIRMNFDPYSVSIEENQVMNIINVHPNPTSGVFKIELNHTTDIYNIVVTDILGKEMLSTVVNGFSTEVIDISDLDKGVYLLEVSNSDMRLSGKIILE